MTTLSACHFSVEPAPATLVAAHRNAPASSFVDIRIGPPVDTFGGAKGEPNARRFEVFGYAFLGRKPPA